jgi:alkylhydroperoxidase family enzyme
MTEEPADALTGPRIEPVAPEARVGQIRELLDQAKIGAASDANIFATLVRAPGLFRRWLPFGGKLLSGKIPARDRELMILRTGWNCDAAYEWGQHARIALGCGLSQHEIDRVVLGPDDPGWA